MVIEQDIPPFKPEYLKDHRAGRARWNMAHEFHPGRSEDRLPGEYFAPLVPRQAVRP